MSTSPDPARRADVLAFAPHPDDCELGCGGTLIRLADRGYTVGLVDLTRGEKGTRGTPETRAEEAEEARRRLGARFRVNLGFPDLGVDSRSADQIAAVISLLRRCRPATVFVSSEHDQHPDHIEGALLVERAAWLAGLARYEAPGDPFRPDRLLFYMGRLVFEPAVIVDVSDVFERKVHAASAFRSQFFRDADDPAVTRISDPDFMDFVAARARHFGSRIGASHGEPFAMREPFGLAGVDELVTGRLPATDRREAP